MSIYHLDEVVKAIKRKVTIPVILFPNDVAGISKFADAIFFMSLLNSSNPYYITGAQALGAPLVKRYGLEPIPLGYLIVGDTGGTVGFVGRAHPIPFEKPELAAIYALAAQYMGMRFVYLEAGSGVERSLPPSMVRAVKQNLEVPLIVGGGIRTAETAKRIARAGADVLVTGTIFERSSFKRTKRLIGAIRSAR